MITLGIILIRSFCLILSKERHAILTIRDVNKDDSAQYRVVADNDLGTDSAIIKIQISGNFEFLFFTIYYVTVCLSKLKRKKASCNFELRKSLIMDFH